LDGSLPDLRGLLAGLVGGVIPLDRFLDWYWGNGDTIEFEGSDEDVDLLNLLFLLYAEYTSDYIDASQFVDALRTDPLVQKELLARRSAVACDIACRGTAHAQPLNRQQSGYRFSAA
jgi:hypothetical protein